MLPPLRLLPLRTSTLVLTSRQFQIYPLSSYRNQSNSMEGTASDSKMEKVSQSQLVLIVLLSIVSIGNSCSTTSIGKDEKASVLRERYGKESCDHVAGQQRVSDHIMPHILNLYAATAKAEDFEIYAPDASFEDPLMCANGVKQIKSAFYSLSKVFSESRMVEYSVEETMTEPGKQQILIDNKQQYKFMGRNIDMISLIKLYVEDGKVIRHEDWWDKKPIGNRDTTKLPLVGRFQEVLRRGSMLATHAMMGFGKDPTPNM